MAFFGLAAFYGCASKPEVNVEPAAQPPAAVEAPAAEQSPVDESVEEVPDVPEPSMDTTAAIRPSWEYYQHALEAINNKDWDLADYCLEIAQNRLFDERVIPWCEDVNDNGETVDYCEMVSQLIVEAMDKVLKGRSSAAKP